MQVWYYEDTVCDTAIVWIKTKLDDESSQELWEIEIMQVEI